MILSFLIWHLEDTRQKISSYRNFQKKTLQITLINASFIWGVKVKCLKIYKNSEYIPTNSLQRKCRQKNLTSLQMNPVRDTRVRDNET